MNSIQRILATALMLSSMQAALAAGLPPDAINVSARDCTERDDIPSDATCMRATVPEDYDNPKGRTIGLDIVILGAKRREGHGAPLFVPREDQAIAQRSVPAMNRLLGQISAARTISSSSTSVAMARHPT